MENNYLPSPGWKRIAVIFLYTVITAAVFYITVKYLIGALLPFIIAGLFASLINPIARRFKIRTGFPQKIMGVIIVLFALLSVGTILFIICERIVTECTRLLDYLGQNGDDIISGILDSIEKAAKKIPLLEAASDGGYLEEAFNEAVGRTVSSLTNNLPAVAGYLVKILPAILFFFIVLVISTFYMTLDYTSVSHFIFSVLPDKASERLRKIKVEAFGVLFKYIRAYFTMFIITAAELLSGFLVLGIDYAFTAAILTAMVDILPIVGAGSVLVPWGIGLIIFGDYFRGIGLIIMFILITILRQVIEPRVVGGVIGLHPLVTLISIYAGINLFGFAGVFIVPLTVLMIKNYLDFYNNKGKSFVPPDKKYSDEIKKPKKITRNHSMW